MKYAWRENQEKNPCRSWPQSPGPRPKLAMGEVLPGKRKLLLEEKINRHWKNTVHTYFWCQLHCWKIKTLFRERAQNARLPSETVFSIWQTGTNLHRGKDSVSVLLVYRKSLCKISESSFRTHSRWLSSNFKGSMPWIRLKEVCSPSSWIFLCKTKWSLLKFSPEECFRNL